MQWWGGGFDLSVVLLWLGVGLAVVWLMAAVGRSFQGRRQGAVEGKRGPVKASSIPPPTEAPLSDHARLAAAGDFANALRALLRQAIDVWTARGTGVPVHATARELLRRVQAMAFPAESLSPMVLAVEAVYFAGRPADRELYERTCEHLARWEATCRPAK